MTPPAQHDFDRRILGSTAHRPWPMPGSPWVMTQTWHNLLFAHWPVDASQVRARIPSGFELDLHEGQAWVGVVPFYMTNVAPRGLPALPGVSAFLELNVRTYVRVHGQAGVYFFSLDASSSIAVAAARRLAHLPYFAARMTANTAAGWIEYRSTRSVSLPSGPPADFAARYRPAGPVHTPATGSLEYFLTERYCLFTQDGRSRTLRVDIHHPPWPLQPGEAEITTNTMAAAAGIRLPAVAPLVHFARRQDAVAWAPSRVEDGRRVTEGG